MDHMTDSEWALKVYWPKVRRSAPDQCWEWQASTRKDGYGQVWYQKTLLSAHRVSYEIAYGPLPDGFVLRHTCDNPRCCNPAHLVAGTHDAFKRELWNRFRPRKTMSRMLEGRETDQPVGVDSAERLW
jgi:hypothetical protein